MHEVVITGIGLVSSLGEGVQTHLAPDSLPVIDETRFAPYCVHSLVPLDLDRYIPKKSDQRQMEPWQRIGTYAAGLALDDAGLKDNAALKSQMHLIVAAGGGERDYVVDGQILTGLKGAQNPGAYLNERLMGDLRPTLFLAQLSNLLAGNISIVHGVTGASRTFMGEEQAGVDALRIAQARIASGQNEIMLVGGSYNAERPDILLIYEMGGFLHKGPFASVWERKSGFIPGSAGAFLVLESRRHAEGRGAKLYAELGKVANDQTKREKGSVHASLNRLIEEAGLAKGSPVLSGATGIAGITAEEREVLNLHGGTVHALQDRIGQSLEAQAPAGVALAACMIAEGIAREIGVTSVGHQRGEGVMRVRALS